MRLRREAYSGPVKTSSNIDEVDRSSMGLNIRSPSPRSMLGKAIPMSGSKENKLRSSSPSVWLKRKLKGKNLTPILSPKRCNAILLSKKCNSYLSLSNDENSDENLSENATIDDVDAMRSARTLHTPRTILTPKSVKNKGGKIFFAEQDFFDSPSNMTQQEEMQQGQDEKPDGHYSVTENEKAKGTETSSRNHIGELLTDISTTHDDERTCPSHAGSVSVSRSSCEYSEGGSRSSKDKSTSSSYSQQPITKYLLLSPKMKGKHAHKIKTPKSKKLTTTGLKVTDAKETKKEHGHGDPGGELPVEWKHREKGSVGREGIRHQHQLSIIPPLVEGGSTQTLERIVDLIDTTSTFASTTSECDSALVSKNTCVSSLTDPTAIGDSFPTVRVKSQRPPTILRMVNKNGANMDEVQISRATSLVRKGTGMSSLTEPEERLNSMLEKVNMNAEQAKRKNITKNWWEEDNSMHPSLMSPKNRRASVDSENDYSFDDFMNSISDMLGGICNSLQKACTDEFDELVMGGGFVADEIDVAQKSKR